MSPNLQIHLFNLVAFSLVVVAIVMLALLGDGKTDLAIMTGLVGVLGSFKPWGAQAPVAGPTGTEADPLSVQGADKPKKPVITEPVDDPDA